MPPSATASRGNVAEGATFPLESEPAPATISSRWQSEEMNRPGPGALEPKARLGEVPPEATSTPSRPATTPNSSKLSPTPSSPTPTLFASSSTSAAYAGSATPPFARQSLPPSSAAAANQIPKNPLNRFTKKRFSKTKTIQSRTRLFRCTTSAPYSYPKTDSIRSDRIPLIASSSSRP